MPEHNETSSGWEAGAAVTSLLELARRDGWDLARPRRVALGVLSPTPSATGQLRDAIMDAGWGVGETRGGDVQDGGHRQFTVAEDAVVSPAAVADFQQRLEAVVVPKGGRVNSVGFGPLPGDRFAIRQVFARPQA